MPELPQAPSQAATTGSAPSSGEMHPGMPRWVRVAIAVVVVLLMILVIGKLAGVDHGPGRHGGKGQTPASQVSDDAQTPPASAEGHRPPAGAEGHKPPPDAGHGPP